MENSISARVAAVRMTAVVTGVVVSTAFILATLAIPSLGLAAAATKASTASAASAGSVNGVAPLPRPADVVQGRFVAPVALSGGVLSVVPAPATARPLVSEGRAAQEIWASPELQGDQRGPLGFGLVTISLRVQGVPHVTRVSAWIGFARSSGNAHCPDEPPGSTSPSDTLSGQARASAGYAAVVIGAAHGSPAVAYTAPDLLCQHVQPATLTRATEVVSVPWRALTGVENQAIQVRVSLPACGTLEGITGEGSAKVSTITVEAVVPDVHGRCAGARDLTETVNLGPVGNPPGAPPPLTSSTTIIRHGPLGPSVTVAPRT